MPVTWRFRYLEIYSGWTHYDIHRVKNINPGFCKTRTWPFDLTILCQQGFRASRNNVSIVLPTVIDVQVQR